MKFRTTLAALTATAALVAAPAAEAAHVYNYGTPQGVTQGDAVQQGLPGLNGNRYDLPDVLVSCRHSGYHKYACTVQTTDGLCTGSATVVGPTHKPNGLTSPYRVSRSRYRCDE